MRIKLWSLGACLRVRYATYHSSYIVIRERGDKKVNFLYVKQGSYAIYITETS